MALARAERSGFAGLRRATAGASAGAVARAGDVRGAASLVHGRGTRTPATPRHVSC